MRYDPSLAETIENIKVQAFKYGIRTTDFFKDYDKHKLGAITENQFMAALKMAIGREAQLGPEELQKIVEAHRTSDGKVRYKEFCEDIEHGKEIVFHVFLLAFNCITNICRTHRKKIVNMYILAALIELMKSLMFFIYLGESNVLQYFW